MESQFMVAKLAGRGPLYASKASKAVLLLGVWLLSLYGPEPTTSVPDLASSQWPSKTCLGMILAIERRCAAALNG